MARDNPNFSIFSFVISLNVAAGHHSVGDLNKSCNIFSFAVIDIVTLGALLYAFIVDILHDFIQTIFDVFS